MSILKNARYCACCKKLVPTTEGPPPRRERPAPAWFVLVAGVALVVGVAWLMVLMRLMWAAGSWLIR